MQFDFITVYAMLITAMCIFLIYNDLKLIKSAKAVKETRDLTKFEVIDYSRNYIIMYSVLAIVAIFMIFFGQQTGAMLMIDIVIVVIAIFEALVCKYRFKLYFSDKEFIFENEIYRFKSIASIKKTRKRGRNYEIKLFNGNTLAVNEKLALKIEEYKNKDR